MTPPFDAKATGSGAPAEFGISGVTRFGSVSRVYEEFLNVLQGPAGMKLYREQIDNCPITGAFLFAANFLARNSTFRLDPAQGATVDQNRALAIAERVRGALFDDLDVTWPDLLSEILTMFGYGWAVHEIVFKRCHGFDSSSAYLYTDHPVSGPSGQGPDVPAYAPSRYNDGWLAFKSIRLRAQETMYMWEWDAESNAIVLQQMAPPDYQIRRVPLNKCLHFRTTTAKNNPEGRSLIRNAVPPYLFKKNIQAIEAIGIERDLAGYPVFQMIEPNPDKGLVPPDIWNPADGNAMQLLTKLQGLVRSVRRDEQEGMVLPWWLKFTLVSTGSRRQFDTNQIVQRYEKSIALSVLADFIMLGHDSTGSKALASTKSQLFTAALNALLDSVCATFNRVAIPMLLRLNGVPTELAPTLAHSSVENIPLDVLGTFIARLAQANAPLFPNTDLLEGLLDAAHLPTSGIADPEASLSEGPQSGESPAEPAHGRPSHEQPPTNRTQTPSGRLPRMRQPQKTGEPQKPAAEPNDTQKLQSEIERVNKTLDELRSSVAVLTEKKRRPLFRRDPEPVGKSTVSVAPRITMPSVTVNMPKQDPITVNIPKPDPVIVNMPEPHVTVNVEKSEPSPVTVHVPPTEVTVTLPQRARSREIRYDSQNRPIKIVDR